ncbi:hypothetical protein V5799_004360 [Amblyomma americanum]|uniref:Uncharacterized protein n=1 Tax=Amblyomma americanum TaxID=6943 RepID=A0AAQ4D6C4_AMBAM
MSLDSGLKRKRPPHVDGYEQFQGDSMASTSDEFQRYYYGSTSDESGRSDDCVDGSDLFEADHGHSAYENSGPSPTPDMDRGRPFQGNWRPSLGPAWSPNLKPMQPSETGRGPQWRSAFMGGTCVVQPETPLILEQGGNYRTDFPRQSPHSHTGRTPHSGGAPYNRRVTLQGSNDSSTNSEFWRPCCSNERGERSTTWPHVNESEHGPYDASESCQEPWHRRRERCITPRHAERAVSSEKERDDCGRRRKHRTHSSSWLDAAYYEPRHSQHRPHRREMEASPQRCYECGTIRRSRSGTRRCAEPSTRLRSDSGSRWRIESSARPHNESGYRLHTSTDFAKRDRRVVDASAPSGAVRQVRSTGTQVDIGSRSWAHWQEPENSETTELCACAQLRIRGQCHRTLDQVRAERSARLVKRDLFCDHSSKRASQREQIKHVRFQEKREEQVVFFHKPSRHSASVATRAGQRVISDREIAQAEVNGEPGLTCGGAQILEVASLSSENRLQVYSLGPGSLGTPVASPDTDRLFHGGATSRLSKEESSPPIRQPDTAAFVEVVNAGNNLAPEDFEECRGGALVQPSSCDHDARVEMHHASGDSQHKEMVASFSVDDQRPNGTEDKAVATIADTDAERSSNSGRAAPLPDPLATIIGPAKDVNAMVRNWLQTSFPAEDTVSSMLAGDERQTTHASDRFAETTEEPCISADAAPTTEVSFWERETESIASTNHPAVELNISQPEAKPVASTDAPAAESNLWERETESLPSTASGDDDDVVVASEHFPSRHTMPQQCDAACVPAFTGRNRCAVMKQ